MSSIEEKSQRLFDAVEKDDLTLVNYNELYNKHRDFEIEEDKKFRKMEEVEYRNTIRCILATICYYLTKNDTIMKYELPDDVPVPIIIDIFKRHGYSVRDTVEHDKKILVFYLDRPQER